MNKLRWLLMGATSGLGCEFSKILIQSDKNIATSVSRKAENKSDFYDPNWFFKTLTADFSKKEDWNKVAQFVEEFSPDRIVYFSGGGPYGDFFKKDFKDHEWAMNVNLLFPMFLIHTQKNRKQDLQISFIGSAIAESHFDKNASSYCSAKHGLKGLIETIQIENSENPLLDIRLFSPGYMDTKLLSQGAWPRQQSGLVMQPQVVALQFFNWLNNEDGRNQNFVLKSI